MAVPVWVPIIFAFLGAILLIALFLKKAIYIVHQGEGIVIERLGQFNRVLKPGWNFVCPGVYSPRAFSWRKTYVDINRKVRDETIDQIRVDLREAVFNFLPQDVFTKDTVPLEVNCVMYYSISDVRQAIYEVEDLTSAVSNTAQTQLKEVFGSMTFSEALSSQEAINAHMKRNFSTTFEAWGLNVERIELQDMRPSRQTADSMKKQMVAERERRAEFIEAEGDKAAMRLRSEGEKLKRINLGVASQEATRKRSEGSAQAQIEIARAEKAALDAVADALSADNCSQTEYMLARRFNNLLRSQQKGNSSMYLPYDPKYITGTISKLPGILGRNTAKSYFKDAPKPISDQGHGQNQQFQDLD